ncbi:MAG: hypothetical protein KHZ29_00380, partial [Desulfovibrionaceae bacterium]|nr:hypothetical protein [Desulfovibrionaceae bacterium]
CCSPATGWKTSATVSASDAPEFALKYLMGNIIRHQIIRAALEHFPIENALPTARAGGRREGINVIYLRCYMPKRVCLSALTL